MTRLAIFDLDGTLLDTIEDLAAACNYALKGCGCPERRLEEYNGMVGRGIYNLFRAALPEDRRTEDMVQKMAGIFIPYYDRHKCDLTKPYPGIMELLGRLSAEKVKLAIASNKYQEGTEKLVARYFPDIDFIKVIGQRDGRPIKPDPEIVREIQAAADNANDDETVYIGDSDVDMQTGANAGVRTIGVSYGFRSRDELAAYSPWAVCDTPEEVAGTILENTVM